MKHAIETPNRRQRDLPVGTLDRLVYDLYGLTEEEIQILEGAP